MDSFFRLVRGDDWSRIIRIKTKNSSTYENLNGWKIYFTLRETDDESTDDTLALISVDLEITTDVTETIFTIPRSETGDLVIGKTYFYDFQVKTPADKVTTLKTGTVKIEKDATKRTS